MKVIPEERECTGARVWTNVQNSRDFARDKRKNQAREGEAPRNVVSRTLSHRNLTSREISLLQVRWEP